MEPRSIVLMEDLVATGGVKGDSCPLVVSEEEKHGDEIHFDDPNLKDVLFRRSKMMKVSEKARKENPRDFAANPGVAAVTPFSSRSVLVSVVPELDDVIRSKVATFVAEISGTLPTISVVNPLSSSQQLGYARAPPNPLDVSNKDALGQQPGFGKSFKDVVLDSGKAHSESKLWALFRAQQGHGSLGQTKQSGLHLSPAVISPI